MQNTPFDERYLQRRLAAMEKRLAALETAPRAGNTSISGGKLTVGAPDSPDRIEVDATQHSIRFNSADGPSTVTAFGSGGVQIESNSSAGQAFPFATRALMWNGSYFATMQINRMDGTASTNAAEIYADIQDSGGGLHRGTAAMTARGTDHDNSQVNLWADGGVSMYSNGRTTDPPTPPADWVTLYVKGNRLYYKDATGTVRGPL